MNRFVVLLLTAILLSCDSSGSVEKDDTELNDQLENLITLEGQRRLENFVLPESDDFVNIPQDPKNPLTAEKVRLGQLLFHEPALSLMAKHASGIGTYSCATCHHALGGFGAGRQQSIGDGGSGWGVRGELRSTSNDYTLDEVDAPSLRSPSILNSAYQRVMLWSGAAGANGPNKNTAAFWNDSDDTRINHLGYDGVETQAILALNTHRMDRIAEGIVASNPTYQQLWNQAFPAEPVSYEKAGLAIAAFERTVLANKSPFQR